MKEKITHLQIGTEVREIGLPDMSIGTGLRAGNDGQVELNLKYNGVNASADWLQYDENGALTLDTAEAKKSIAIALSSDDSLDYEKVGNEYTIKVSDAFTQGIDNSIREAEQNSKAYADTQINAAVEEVNKGVQQNATQIAWLQETKADKSYADTKASQATQEAKEYTDEKVSAVANGQLKLSVKDNGNVVLSNANGESKEFMPATPSGDPMHYAYESMGAEYNDSGADKTKTGVFGDTIVHKDGYWYLNELGDLTNSDIRNVYNAGEFSTNIKYLENRWMGYNNRTNMSLSGTNGGVFSASYMFYNSGCETIMVGAKGIIALVGNGVAMFQNAVCKKILNTLKLSYLSNAQDMFTNARKLEYVDINNLKLSLSFAQSQNLKNISILNMIKNAEASATITITLHADAYARAMADTEITTALSNHPNVTLASA